MINTWSKKWWFCLEESSLSLGSLRNKQRAVLPAFCSHECFHAVVHSWVLACFLRTECIVWGSASWSRTLVDTPSFQSSLVKQRPINRPLAIFHLTKLWFTCQWLQWWCLCTGHHSASTALLSLLSCHCHTSKSTWEHLCFTKPKGQGKKKTGEISIVVNLLS